MSRKRNEQTLGEVIKDMMRIYGLEDKIVEVEVQKAWAEIMGPAIAGKTRYMQLKKKKLIIQMDSGVLKEEFSFAKQRIIEMINEKLNHEAVTVVEIR